MTQEHWNTLEMLLPWMEMWDKHRLMSSDGIVKRRVEWLCDEFRLGVVDWGCQGCVSSRCTTLYAIYKRERKNWNNGTS